MKTTNLVLRILLLLLLLIPIGGTIGLFPEPTADLYGTAESWEFMSALLQTGYMMPLIGGTFALCAVLLFTGHQALSALILLPLTVNIMAFHWFTNASPISAESSLGYLLLALNLYLLWYNRQKYQALLKK
ncbi:MAG: hypothetical protein AB7J40_01050 [Candidatus Altimarinota bacterium]